MANSRSALKRVRQTETRTKRNRLLKARIRAFRREVIEAVEAGKSDEARKAYDRMASAADKAAKRGVIHRNTASRYKSRVAARVATL